MGFQKKDIELEGNDAHDIHDDSLVIAYLKYVNRLHSHLRSKTMLCIKPNGQNGKVIIWNGCRQMDKYG